MGDYDKEEKKERLVLKHFFLHIGCSEYHLSAIGSKKPWDFYFDFNDKRYIGDVKCTNVEVDTYDRILLEDSKLKGLLLEAYKMGCSPHILYIMHYKNNYTRTVNLTPAILNDSRREWINVNGKNKPVYFIKNSHSKILKFETPSNPDLPLQI